MPINPGEVVTASKLNHLKSTSYTARASANLTGVVVDTDIPGATITLTTETDGATYAVVGTFDMDWEGTAAITQVIIGKLDVDGVIQAGQAHAEQPTADSVAGNRVTTAQVWQGTLSTAGTHTLKLKASIPDADQRTTITHTAIQVTIHEVV